MSRMEEDAKKFLQRVVWSLTSGLLWLILNLGVGIYNGWMVPEGKIRLGNILFYLWMIVSLVGLIWFNYKIWKEKFPHG